MLGLAFVFHCVYSQNLAAINYDHFELEKGNERAYIAVHTEACSSAIAARNTANVTEKNILLATAFMQNAWGDHFLTDR